MTHFTYIGAVGQLTEFKDSFSWADELEASGLISSEWKAEKERGDALLASTDYDGAEAAYKAAFRMTQGALQPPRELVIDTDEDGGALPAEDGERARARGHPTRAEHANNQAIPCHLPSPPLTATLHPSRQVLGSSTEPSGGDLPHGPRHHAAEAWPSAGAARPQWDA